MPPESPSFYSMHKDNPTYIAATIKQLPTLDDPRETRIISVMRQKLLTTPYARGAFWEAGERVLENWTDANQHIEDETYIHDITQKGAREVATALNSTIVSGKEHLDSLPKGKPIMIVSNHLGAFKLISMTPDELRVQGITHPVPNIYYPYLTYFAPFQPVAEVLGNNIYEGSFEEPGRLGKLFRATGSIDVPPPIFKNPDERTNILIESTQYLFKNHPNAALVIFPEGGTTGKRSGGDIYDLERFHTGGFVIATRLGIPILPIGQRFNVEKGMELGIFSPINIDPASPREHFEEVAERVRIKMQSWLKQK